MTNKQAKHPVEQLNKVKGAAIETGKQYAAPATEYVKELYKDGEQWLEKTTEEVKQTISKINFEDGYQTLKDFSAKANQYATDTAEEWVDNAISNGQKWQSITAKAISGSLDLAARQQTIVFDTLAALKDQVITGAQRTKKLFQ